ncbi:EboA domain-containing protein [Azospirillum sp. SYSU D00513]|uniref:EboA domain-containing protein n=1 Tax=Azospirillum sp. SYSU D00513 TaxID=2812561 RepID=UPI001A97C426|nr:EboA domain-containing protein [Azospirillum sp. SYSU D00513]
MTPPVHPPVVPAHPPHYHPVDTQHVLFLLRQWLKRAAPPEAVDWLDEVRDALADGQEDGFFIAAFAAVPSRTGRTPLSLRPEDRAETVHVRPGWYPDHWTADEAARAMLLLSYDDSDADAYASMLRGLLKAGQLDQSVALYRSLPLLPWPERHVAWASAASRSDQRPLFEALAICNPYPAERFDETCWNRMIMKAVFLGIPLDRVEGLERRANNVLAHELRDFAQQRREAGEPVRACLWRAVGSCAAGPVLMEMERMLASRDPEQQQAAALVLHQSRDPRAASILDGRPDLREGIAAGRLCWERLSPPPTLRAAG